MIMTPTITTTASERLPRRREGARARGDKERRREAESGGGGGDDDPRATTLERVPRAKRPVSASEAPIKSITTSAQTKGASGAAAASRKGRALVARFNQPQAQISSESPIDPRIPEGSAVVNFDFLRAVPRRSIAPSGFHCGQASVAASRASSRRVRGIDKKNNKKNIKGEV